MNQLDLTPVAVATVVAATLFSPTVAEVAGPYAIIYLASVAGACVALMQRAKTTRMNAALFFFGATTMALLLTVPLSLGVSVFLPSLKAHWLFAPMAAGIGYSGSDLFKWVFQKLNRLVDILIEMRNKP